MLRLWTFWDIVKPFSYAFGVVLAVVFFTRTIATAFPFAFTFAVVVGVVFSTRKIAITFEFAVAVVLCIMTIAIFFPFGRDFILIEILFHRQ